MKFKCIVILLFTVLALNAQDSKRKTLESQLKKNQEEYEVTKKMLAQTSNSKKSAIYKLNLLSEQIRLRKDNISLLNHEIGNLDEEIATTEKDIKTLETELSYKKNNYAKSLQHISFQKNTQDKLLFVLAGDDFAQSYRRMRYLKEYADWQKQQGKEITSKQTKLKKQNQLLAVTKNDKLTLVQQKEKEEKNLKQEETSQQGEVKNLAAQEKDLQKELDKKKKQAEELNRQIEKAIAYEIERANAEAERIRKANAEAEKAKKTNEIKEVRQAESTGGYAMTKVERQLSSDFASNKGKLPYPLRGSYKIISRFGQQKPDGMKFVTLNNNGIDIQTTANNEAKSVFGGEVTKVFMVPGFNNSVIVRHGNYLTVYSNLSEVYVSANDKVKTGQAIGKIFTDTEDGNISVLHFELWKERTKLDPAGWLNR